MLYYTQDDLISELSPLSGVPKRTKCLKNGTVCALMWKCPGSSD